MSKKKTQADLLQEIADLLLPMSNLARYQIQQINAQIQKEQAGPGAGRTAEGEMKKLDEESK